MDGDRVKWASSILPRTRTSSPALFNILWEHTHKIKFTINLGTLNTSTVLCSHHCLVWELFHLPKWKLQTPEAVPPHGFFPKSPGRDQYAFCLCKFAPLHFLTVPGDKVCILLSHLFQVYKPRCVCVLYIYRIVPIFFWIFWNISSRLFLFFSFFFCYLSFFFLVISFTSFS